jgi:PadR family transcriptional regulator PadR
MRQAALARSFSTRCNRLNLPRPVFRVDIFPGLGSHSGYMSTQDAKAQDSKDRLELLQGTLDLLILRTLIFGSQHGQGIARAIQQTSEQELLVEHGALYPALQRLEERGWISAKWGVSSNNRKARFYALTATGRKQLVKETNKWKRLTGAIARILGSEATES